MFPKPLKAKSSIFFYSLKLTFQRLLALFQKVIFLSSFETRAEARA